MDKPRKKYFAFRFSSIPSVFLPLWELPQRGKVSNLPGQLNKYILDYQKKKKIEEILGDFDNAGVFVWFLGLKKYLNLPKSKRVVTHAKKLFCITKKLLYLIYIITLIIIFFKKKPL